MMNTNFFRPLVLSVAVLCGLLGARSLLAAEVLVPTGAVWKYLDNGSDQGPGWRRPEFNDGGWTSGPAQLGYGDGDEATLVSYGPNLGSKFITTYFRRSFTVTGAAGLSNLTVRLLRDDGGVVFLNGVEVFRSNLPAGPVMSQTLAVAAIGGPQETTEFVSADVTAAVLHEGTNVVAVEIHQVNATSSDLSFDLELLANAGGVPPVSNRPPTVAITIPQEGQVFAGPTNLLVAASADDLDGSFTVQTVEFFANGASLGLTTNLPTADPIGPFRVNWSNVATGNYTLTAVARDDHAARGTSAPVHITVQTAPPIVVRELHTVGIYSGAAAGGGSVPNHEVGDAAVTVNRPGKSVTLFLISYEPTHWHISAGAGTVIERVFVSSYYPNTVDGVPSGVLTTVAFFGSVYQMDTPQYYALLPRLCEITEQEMASFHGSYAAPYPTPFVIDSVQNDPRLHCNYPQPETNNLRALQFRLAFYHEGSPLFFQDYTATGPVGGGNVLPGLYAVPDAGQRYFYSADPHFARKIDSLTGVAEELAPPPGLPALSWPIAAAYDSQRDRVLFITFGGEGFLYSYAPTSGAWSVVSSLNNLDLDALVYHAATDRLFAIQPVYGGAARLREFSASGTPLRTFPLMVLPADIAYGAVRSELISVGEFLVWLTGPDSRMYVIDPRTGEVRLTYRQSGPAPNRPPSVAVTTPTEGAVLTSHTVVLEAFATDSDDGVDLVEFYANGLYLGAAWGTTPGHYSMNWEVNISGSYTLTAVATDEHDLTTESAPVHVTVNLPPAVPLGPGDLLNINFGAGEKIGPAAIGKNSNDVWNLMGQPYNDEYEVEDLRRSDGITTGVGARLQNSGGIWGNQSGDTMYDSYVYPNSGAGDGDGDMFLTITGLSTGRYNLVLYGHADHLTPDNRPESDSFFKVQINGHHYGPLGTLASPLWTVDQGWQEGRQYVVFRDLLVPAEGGTMAVTIKPGYDGHAGTLGPWDRTAILNGLQLLRIDPAADADGDGVPDAVDQCPNTPPGTVVNAHGCSLAQLCPCDGGWRNHTEYVGCVIDHAWSFYRHGLLTETQRCDAIRDAVHSDCGRHEGLHIHLQPETAQEIGTNGRRFVMNGHTTNACVLECSTNLLHWTPVATNATPNLQVEITDPQANQGPARFYRLRRL